MSVRLPRVLAVLAVFLFCILLVSFGQTSKRRRSTKPKAVEAPCGDTIPTFDEFEKASNWCQSHGGCDDEWHYAGETSDATFYYNKPKSTCVRGIFRVWVKSLFKGTATTDHAMTRYELNCRSNQLRMISVVAYNKEGQVVDSATNAKAPWEDTIPDSVGESVWRSVCHRL
jgi:hypothetical protein